MPRIDLCENCNGTGAGSGLVVATVTFTDPAGDAYGRECFRQLVCRACADRVACLDFAEFIRRHETRPRVLELP